CCTRRSTTTAAPPATARTTAATTARRAGNPRRTAPGAGTGTTTRGRGDDRRTAADRSGDARRQRLLRGRRVRVDLGAPQSDRAARRPGRPARPERAVGAGARVRADGGRAARHHPV